MNNAKTLLIILIISSLISCSKFPDLGNGYKLDYNANNDIYILNNKKTVVINGHILKYNYNTQFIIAEQKPREVILKYTYNNPNYTYKIRELIFNKSSLRHYWIINKMNDSIYGPLKKEEYMQKREALRVPKKLQLK